MAESPPSVAAPFEHPYPDQFGDDFVDFLALVPTTERSNGDHRTPDGCCGLHHRHNIGVGWCSLANSGSYSASGTPRRVQRHRSR